MVIVPFVLCLAGALLGAMVTLTSVGAGALGATLLLALYPLRMRLQKLIASDIVHAVPLTLVVEGPDRKRQTVEIKAVVAMALRNFKLQLAVRPDEVRERLSFTLGPESLPLRFVTRP